MSNAYILYIFFMNETVQAMIYAKLSLQNIDEECRDSKYNEILQFIEEYIDAHCVHEIVHDLIDIDPDRSKSITYCEVCGKTFP